MMSLDLDERCGFEARAKSWHRPMFCIDGIRSLFLAPSHLGAVALREVVDSRLLYIRGVEIRAGPLSIPASICLGCKLAD